MKIKIESDVFNIINRIKEIDDGYFVVYDLKRACFEIHNHNQVDTYCLSAESLDSRVLEKIYYTCVDNLENIMDDINNYNNKLEEESSNKIKCQSEYMLKEIYNFASNSSKEMSHNNAFSTIWR